MMRGMRRREFAENLAAFVAVLCIGGAVLAAQWYGLNHPERCDRLRVETVHAWQQTVDAVRTGFEEGQRAYAKGGV